MPKPERIWRFCTLLSYFILCYYLYIIGAVEVSTGLMNFMGRVRFQDHSLSTCIVSWSSCLRYLDLGELMLTSSFLQKIIQSCVGGILMVYAISKIINMSLVSRQLYTVVWGYLFYTTFYYRHSQNCIR